MTKRQLSEMAAALAPWAIATVAVCLWGVMAYAYHYRSPDIISCMSSWPGSQVGETRAGPCLIFRDGETFAATSVRLD
jgi:hypothetical protein